MLAKRIVPCLDIKDGKTVKGINFVNFRDAGDPVELGAQYSREGADELVYLDITASHEGRKTFTELVKQVAAHISIPFTVGGGINELKDVDRLLSAGADKVSINSAALRNPALIEEIAKNFGSQVCVVAIDANFENNDWLCYLNGGRVPTDKYLFQWASEAESRGGSADSSPEKQAPRPWQGRKGGYCSARTTCPDRRRRRARCPEQRRIPAAAGRFPEAFPAKDSRRADSGRPQTSRSGRRRRGSTAQARASPF